MKIYTKTGDDGTTGLRGAGRVRKDDVRVEACGEVDETNAALGVLIAALPAADTAAAERLTAVQNDLFTIGASLATPPAAGKPPAGIDAARIAELETAIDAMEKGLPPLAHFILPQGSPACAAAHLARAVCRRAERRAVALSGLEAVEPNVLVYLNRLSDYLFVLSRALNRRDNGREIPWLGDSAGTPAGSPQVDRMEATLQKLQDDKKKRATLFEKASSDLQRKKELADKLFRQSVEQINKEGGKVDKPLRDMDLD